MYHQHYGLTERPFQLTPDPRYWFETATHRKAMAYLGYGLAQGEGFIVITGDIGAGKTTLVGHLMDTIDPHALNVIRIVSSQVDPDDLLRIVAGGLGAAPGGLSKAELLAAIERGLHATARAGRRTLLIVDEAQALPIAALEELRMLSNFQASGHALLQIFLLGQPEFRDNIRSSSRLEQLRQRVIAVHHLEPMEAEEIEPYLHHRLTTAGWSGRPDITPDAARALYRATDGVPRRLNQLMSRLLLFGAIEHLDTIDADAVEAVVADLDDEHGPEADSVGHEDAAEATDPAVSDDAVRAITQLSARVAQLEARIEDQDVALRRVLTLLVDWVEGGARRPEPAVRDGRAA